MRSGKLDNTILLKRNVLVDDGYGNEVPSDTPVTIATLRAQIIDASTDEFVRDWGISADRLRIFRTRYIDDVRLSDLLVHDGGTYDIKDTKLIGRRRGLELRCVQRGV